MNISKHPLILLYSIALSISAVGFVFLPSAVEQVKAQVSCGWSCDGPGQWSCKDPKGATYEWIGYCSDGSRGKCTDVCVEEIVNSAQQCGGSIVVVTCPSATKFSIGCCNNTPPQITPTTQPTQPPPGVTTTPTPREPTPSPQPSGRIWVDPVSGTSEFNTFCQYDVFWQIQNVSNPRITFQHSDQSGETTWCDGSSWCPSTRTGFPNPNVAQGNTTAGKQTSYRLYDGDTLISGPATFNCSEVAPACSVNFTNLVGESSFSMFTGDTVQLEAKITDLQSGVVDQVDFSTSASSNLVVSPQSDSLAPYRTSAVALQSSANQIQASATAFVSNNTGQAQCTDSVWITIQDRPEIAAWWQVRDADVTSGGRIGSPIPSGCGGTCSPYFGLEGAGGYPGVVVHNSSVDWGNGEVARDPSERWVAKSRVILESVSGSYFFDRIPDTGAAEIAGPVIPKDYFGRSGLQDKNGYYWIKHTQTGSVEIKSQDIGARKVVVLIDKSSIVKISGPILVDENNGGFFMLVVKDGSIVVDDNLGDLNPTLEGIYFADHKFRSAENTSNKQLTVRGVVVGKAGIELNRDLGDTENETRPSEYFIFGPDLILNFPPAFASEVIDYREIIS